MQRLDGALAAMPTQHAVTPSKVLKRGAFADMSSVENSTPRTGSARKSSATGKGIPKMPSNSRFKQKVALSALRTSPKTPVLRTGAIAKKVQGAQHAGPRHPDAPPAKALITPRGVREMRQSASGSVLGTSHIGAYNASLSSEPSFDAANTSSILSENSTVTFGTVDGQLSQSFSLGLSLLSDRDSLGGARDSMGSVRLSSGPTFGVTCSGDQNIVLLQKKIEELQGENSTLRGQCELLQVLVLSLHLQALLFK